MDQINKFRPMERYAGSINSQKAQEKCINEAKQNEKR